MAGYIDEIQISITVKKYGYKPTYWTGDRDQKPEKELIEELTFNNLGVRESIKKLSEWIKD